MALRELDSNVDAGDSTAILTALATVSAANLIIIPQANGLQVGLYADG